MSDLSNITTPSDLIEFNKVKPEFEGITVTVGINPQDDIEVIKTLIESLYDWHVKMSDDASNDGELTRSKAWAQDAGILYTVYKALDNFEI